MPKLNKATAKAVSEAASGFALLPDGVYPAKLRKCENSPKPGPSGVYWIWEFEITGEEGEEGRGRRFWLNTSLSEKAQWKLNETFTAFGVAPDTDTDELVGHEVRIQLGTRTIQEGNRAGEETNQIEKVLPFETADDDEAKDDPFA